MQIFSKFYVATSRYGVVGGLCHSLATIQNHSDFFVAMSCPNHVSPIAAWFYNYFVSVLITDLIRFNDTLLKLIGMAKIPWKSLGLKIWNYLPPNIKSETIFHKFNKYKNILFETKCRCNVYENIEISSCKFCVATSRCWVEGGLCHNLWRIQNHSDYLVTMTCSYYISPIAAWVYKCFVSF